MPAIVFAIGVVGLCAALVFDRLWLDAARVELRTAAEAAALAAAARLTDDDQLRGITDWPALLESARENAARVAAENHVAGHSVELDRSAGGDVRFGVVTDDANTGRAVFLETEYDPTTVVVTAQAVHSRRNGVALFFCKLTGISTGNVIGRAGVTIDNAVVGVRPFGGVPVPALPLGILAADPEGLREDTWRQQITQQQGTDRFGFDDQEQRVTQGPDGIREITLTFAAAGNTDSAGNVEAAHSSSNCCLLNMGNGLTEQGVRRQIFDGWSQDELEGFGGQFVIDGAAVPVESASSPTASLWADFERNIGRPRICVLYQIVPRSDRENAEHVLATELVAGRILSIDGDDTGAVRIVFQPTVITTRTAVLSDATNNSVENPYLYKLHLTH